MKLNSTIYNKLLLQATEAKAQGFEKLAAGVLDAIGPHPKDEDSSYSYEELENDIYKDLWKSAVKMMSYYDLNSAQIEKLGETIAFCADTVVGEMEKTLGVDSVVKGPFEPSVPGESE